MLIFEKPVGSAADLMELEYISSLHQTCMPNVRQDASIEAIDIAYFLRSKYGIKISSDQVRKTILHGFAGSDDSNEVLDLSEMISILIIPYLIKRSQDLSITNTQQLQTYIIPTIDSATANSISSKDVIQGTLEMIFMDALGISREEEVELTLEKLKQIFVHYEEHEIANDYQVLKEMMEAIEEANDKRILNKSSFLQVLTEDVLLFINEEQIKIDLSKMIDEHRFKEQFDYKDDLEHSKIMKKKEFTTIFTAPAIDLTLASYHSRGFAVIIWTLWMVSYLSTTYLSPMQGSVVYCEDAYSVCVLGQSVSTWLFWLAQLITTGLLFVGLGSLGNSNTTKHIIPLLIAIIVILTGSIIPFIQLALNGFITYGYEQDRQNPITYSEMLEPVPINKNYQVVSFVCTFVLAILAVLFQVRLLIQLIMNKIVPKRIKFNKDATLFKTNAMIENAKQIHAHSNEKEQKLTIASSSTTNTNESITFSNQAMLKFIKVTGTQQAVEPSGGIIWTIKQIYSGDLYSKHGITLPIRVLAGNFALIFIAMIVFSIGIYYFQYFQANFGVAHQQYLLRKTLELFNLNQTNLYNDTVTESVEKLYDAFEDFPSILLGENYTCPSYFQRLRCFASENFTKCDNFEVTLLCSLQEFDTSFLRNNQDVSNTLRSIVINTTLEVSNISFNYLYPTEKHMVTIPIMVGSIIAFLTVVALLLLYIPSTVSLIKRFRTGVIPTLRDQWFFMLRMAPDHTTLIIGSMFWGAFFSSILVGSFIGLIVFLFLWQVTRRYAFAFLYYIVGFLITLILKMIVLRLLRNALFIAFYRKIPASANLVNLALECWSIGYTTGTVFVRTLKLMLATLFYVGRIDTPFLAQRAVAIGGFELDFNPLIFRKDILSHEAHHHPYIETLGLMYMMKLRYGDNFGKRSGSSWRLLFITALMPWVRKYRVMARELDTSTFYEENEEKKDEEKKLKKKKFHRKFKLDLKPTVKEPIRHIFASVY